jgi:ligand-binding sensor domain-containing protein
LQAQNIFPVKLTNCKTAKFCLDCGDIKAGYVESEFAKVEEKLNNSLNLKGVKGAVKFQVLVDAKGRGCVLSHTDQSNTIISQKIVKELNKFRDWTPALKEGVKKEKTSITVVFIISDNKLTGKIERVDMKAFKKSFDKPTKPQIFNESYTYTNRNLDSYKITVWNSSNSNLANNMNDHISIDQKGLIWLSVDEGLVTFDGETFKRTEQNITDKGKFFTYSEIAIDNNNVKWVDATKNIYSFNDSIWIKYDEEKIGTKSANKIINNPKTNEVFFCTFNGLIVKKGSDWITLSQDSISELPSNNISFAKRDSKNRLWIGTYQGTVMINEKGELTNFENSNTVLKGKTITSMSEDPLGNIYFSLYEFDRKDKKQVNNDEGIAIYSKDETIKQFTTDNSGIPFNHTTCVLYDKNENVLWISTDRAGLVRYDLNGSWENYHNENSEIPTSYISTMTFDEAGNLYLATRQGLVKIEKK